MDRAWAADRLQAFIQDIDRLPEGNFSSLWSDAETRQAVQELITVDPVMRDLMNAARPGLGDYVRPQARSHIVQIDETELDYYQRAYWTRYPKRNALQAIGVLTLGEEVRGRMRPDSPDLVADQFHPWVWEAAAPLWFAGSPQAAVLAAAQSVNARLQQKLARTDTSDASLAREAFSRNDPVPGHPRLRFPGDHTSEIWRSRQNGGIDFGAGCFEGLRNPAAHEHEMHLTEQVALEQLAAFSLLARWIDECTVETVQRE